ncbi:hypothetical protein LX32DRAFT_346689 [Colletotrichum zoysiae]|uniref:Secreted protein n=1 Tax=Colletotrichum zoysiae TaxID=1216348 RepID=A0AAD9M5P5_9PEZI|nr:hypothetical protein LX32DRAFT_346689 [Colletotrichum zoysiae]
MVCSSAGLLEYLLFGILAASPNLSTFLQRETCRRLHSLVGVPTVRISRSRSERNDADFQQREHRSGASTRERNMVARRP